MSWGGEGVPGNVEPAAGSQELVGVLTAVEEVDQPLELRWVFGADVGSLAQQVLRVADATDEGVVEEYLSRDPHFTFIETLPWSTKRNPRVFRGRYISVTRRDDGSLRLNFKPMPKLGADLSVDNYAFEVYRELRQALIGLVEEE